MMEPRALGLNAVFLVPPMGGLETLVRALVAELRIVRPDLRVVVFINEDARPSITAEPWADEVELATHPLLGRRPLRAASELLLLAHLARHHRLDVLHSLGHTGPLRTPCAHVVSVSDLIWLHDPQSVGPRTYWTWRLLVPQLVRHADRVHTLSNASRWELVDAFHVPPERIDVVEPGPGTLPSVAPTPEPALRAHLDLPPGRLILCVSAKRSHKNLVRLIRAMELMRRRFPDTLLVMPGSPTSHEQELRAEAARLGISEHVVFPGHVSVADLEGLYQAAACLAFPSLREGFGLPVLEAMRRGVPVACARVSAMPEVAGDAARYFDPEDVDDMAAAIGDLLSDLALGERLVAAGHERERIFSWRRTAEGLLECYERAVAVRTLGRESSDRGRGR
jgi:glycosyltransferase involved in cell wall biosynthesis